MSETLLKDLLRQDNNLHHVLSFNHLLEYQISEIVTQYSNFGTLLNSVKYDVSIENITVMPDEILPGEAHHFGLNYTCSIVGDVVLRTENVDDSFVYRLRTTIARLPLMTGRTLLSSPLQQAESYPFTGAFIVRGKLRSIPPTKSTIFDQPVLMIAKNEMSLQVRSRHPAKSFRSTSTIDFKVDTKKNSEGILLVRLAFQKTYVHVFLLIQALGCSAAKFCDIVKLFAGKKYDRKIFCRYELSMKKNKYTDKAIDIDSAEMLVAGIYGKTIQSTGHSIINTETFPHIIMDDKEQERNSKVLYLARVLVLLIFITHQLIPEAEYPYRDEYSSSQITSSANHLGSLFRLLFINHIRTCGKLLRRALMKLPAPQATKAARVDMVKIIGEHRLSARILSAVASGVWSLLRKGMSLAINNNNDEAVLMQLRRISSSLTTTDGTHTRPRNVSTDQYGFVCAAYTPDGESTGLVYEMAMTAKVSPPVINRHILTEILMFQLRDIIKEIAAPVSANAEVFFVFDSNSVPICKTSNKDEFIERFRKLRRTLTISPYSFVCFQQNVIVVQSDEGFLCRPLLIISEISRLTPTHTFNDALAQGIIEYVSVFEQKTLCKIATSSSTLCPLSTHMEITQASFLGLMCGGSPFATAMQGPRLSYFGNQRKQAITSSIKDRRGAISTTQLWHSHKSLCVPFSEQCRPTGGESAGTPLIIAFLALEGNEEDAVIMNKACVERGALMASTTRTYSSEAAPPNASFSEKFEVPGEVVAKKNVSYSAMESNGLPKEGVEIKGGNIVISKTRSIKRTLKNSNKSMNNQFMLSRRDISTSSRLDESGIVTETLHHTLPTGTRANVSIRTSRPVIVGDKVTSRHAQKSTVSRLWPQEDMPVSMETGCSPDLIASPLSLTSRMTMCSLIEALTGKAVCISGDTDLGIDNQNYDVSNKIHLEQMGNILRQHGFSSTGKEKYIDGRTGDVIEGMVFTGVVDYLRLVHLVRLCVFARRCMLLFLIMSYYTGL